MTREEEMKVIMEYVNTLTDDELDKCLVKLRELLAEVEGNN